MIFLGLLLVFVGHMVLATEHQISDEPLEETFPQRTDDDQVLLLQTNFQVEQRKAGVQLSTFLAKLQSSSNFVKMDPKELCGKIVAPSGGDYNLDQPDKQSWSQVGQDELLDKVLGWNKDGFFIEAGAADGETNSNTLFYEKKGWNGLLVEPNPASFRKLLEKNRNAYAFNGALSTNGAIGTVGLRFADCYGFEGQCSQLSNDSSPDAVPVTMAPMEALLDCVGRKTVDFWSLDVEGVEHLILANTHFDNIEVGLMLIEMNKGDENNNGIIDTMTKYGFKELGRTEFDRIYINPSYFLNRGLKFPESI
jgi:FkbM family methyltransferase